MRLRYTEAAGADLDRLLDETAKTWPTSFDVTVERSRTFERILLEFPSAGQKTRVAGVRRYVLIPLPYAALYRPSADEIVILRLRHLSRRPFGSCG